MVEVSNINPQSMSKSDVKQYNKDIAELQASIEKLSKLQSSLEDKINISDNTIISTIIAQIESTKQFAIKTIENGEITRESNKEILRESYETIQTLLKDNRKEFVVNSNNQIVTLREVLNEYKEEQRIQQKIVEEKISKTSASNQSNTLLNQNLVKGTESTVSLLNDVMSSTQLGMALQTTYKPIKQAWSILSTMTKGVTGSAKSVGHAVSDLFNLPSHKNAKSLEEDRRKSEKKRDKSTDEFRAKVLSKLSDVNDGIKKVGKDDGGFFSNLFGSDIGKLLIGGAAAGLGTLIWKQLLSDEHKEKIKKFVNENVLEPIGTYLRNEFPTLAKVFNHEKEVSERKEEEERKQDEKWDESLLGVKEDDGEWTARLKGIARAAAEPGLWLERTISSHLKTWDPLNKYHDANNNRTDISDYVIPTKYEETGNRDTDILSYLKSKGYSDEAAAGIYGNIMQESKGNPLAYNKAGGDKGAFGMFQWRGDRQDNLKRYAEARGLDYKDWKTQIDFAIQEENSKIGIEKMNSFKTSDEAARYVRDYFERSGETDFHKGGIARLNYAKEGMSKLAQINLVPDTGKMVPANTLLSDTGVIKSADIESLKLADNQSQYDINSQSLLLNSANEVNSQQFNTLFSNMNNSMTNGFSSVTNAIKSQVQPSLASNIDDPGIILINSGGA